MSTPDCALESLPKSDEISDLDFVIIDEVDNCEHDSLCTPPEHEPIGESSVTQPRKYHRRVKKDLALSLLDNFAWQSGGSARGTLTTAERTVTPSSSSKQKVLVSTASALLPKSIMKPKTSLHLDSILHNPPLSSSDEKASKSSDGPQDKPEASNEQTKQPEVLSKKPHHGRKRKSTTEVEHLNNDPVNSVDLIVINPSEVQEKKHKHGTKASLRSNLNKNKTAIKNPVCNNQILSISLPRFNWLEKKLSDGAKLQSEKIEGESEECCIMIEDDVKRCRPKSSAAPKPHKDKRKQSPTLLEQPDKCSSLDIIASSKIDETVDTAIEDKTQNHPEIKNAEDTEGNASPHWNEWEIVNESNRDEDGSSCQLDLEPIMLPVIDEDGSNESSPKHSKPFSITKFEESYEREKPEPDSDEVILLDIMTDKESDNEDNINGDMAAQPMEVKNIFDTQVKEEDLQNEEGRTCSEVYIQDASTDAADKKSNNHDKEKSEDVVEADIESTKVTFEISSNYPPKNSREECEQIKNSLKGADIEENNNLNLSGKSFRETEDEPAVLDFKDKNEFLQMVQSKDAISLQDAIHAAMFKAIDEDTMDDVSTSVSKIQPQVERNAASCPSTVGYQSISQTHLPPKKRMLSLENSDGTAVSNRSPPLSKRRKTISIVQKVRPIVLSDSDEQQGSRGTSINDIQNAILINEDSDEEESGVQSVAAQKSNAIDDSASSVKMIAITTTINKLENQKTLQPATCSPVASSPSIQKSIDISTINSAKSKKSKSCRKHRTFAPKVAAEAPRVYQALEAVAYRRNPSDHVTPNPGNMTAVQIYDGTVTFDEMRALQPPQHKTNKQLLHQAIATPNMVPTTPLCIDPLGDREVSQNPWHFMYDSLNNKKPEPSNALKSLPVFSVASYEPSTSAPAYGLSSVVACDPAFNRRRASSVGKVVQTAPLPSTFNPLQGSPGTGHAFHPVNPSHQSGSAKSFMRPIPTASAITAIPYVHPHRLPRQFAKPVDPIASFAPTTQSSTSNYPGSFLYPVPVPQQANPQMCTIGTDRYAVSKVPISSQPSVNQFHSYTSPTSNWYRSNSTGSQIRPMSSCNSFYSPDKPAPLPIQKEFRPGTLTDSRSHYAPRVSETLHSTMPLFDSRFSSSSASLHHGEYFQNQLPNSQPASHLHWSQARFPLLPKNPQESE